MTKKIVTSILLCFSLCFVHISAFAQSGSIDTIPTNQIIENEVVINTDLDNIATDYAVVPPGLQASDYKQTNEWRRSKILLGCGIGSLALGAATFAVCFTLLSDSDAGKAGGAFLGSIFGGPFILGSIPLFILAHNNKVKAKNSVTNIGLGAITAPMGGSKREVMPALTFSLNF